MKSVCFSLALPVSSVSGESGGAFLHAKMRCPLNTAKTYQYPSSKPFPVPVCDQILDLISDQTNKRFFDPFYETICERSCEPFHGPLSVPFGQNRQIPRSLQKTVRRESQKLNRQYPPEITVSYIFAVAVCAAAVYVVYVVCSAATCFVATYSATVCAVSADLHNE